MKKLLLLFVPVLFCSISCEEDEVDNNSNNSICNPQTDQLDVTNTLNTIPTCISEIEQGETMELINYFVEFNNGEATELFSTAEMENWAENLATIVTDNIIVTQFDGDDWIGDNYYFNFDQNKGVYSWNATTGTYDVSAGDIIEVNFPSSPDESNNNATLKIFNYIDYTWQDPEMDNNVEIVEIPTSMSCELEVDNQIIFTINHSISFNDSFMVDNYEIPSNISVSVFIDPVNIELQANRLNPYLFNAGFSINSSNCDINVVGETTLLTTNYLDIITEDPDEWVSEINYISLDISVSNLVLDGVMDCQLLDDMSNGLNDDISVSDINTVTGIDVVYQGENIGYLNLISNDSDDYSAEDIEIVYCDDTQQSVVFYINPLMNSIENLIYPYAGLWWDDLEEGDIF